MSEIKTIEQRFQGLMESYDRNQIEYSTEIQRHENGWLAKAFLIIDGRIVSTGHRFKSFEDGEDAVTIAETQAVSRAIGFHLGDKHIHSLEELEELAQKKVRQMRGEYKKNKSIQQLNEMVDAERNDHIKRRMQRYVSDLMSEKSKKAAKQ